MTNLIETIARAKAARMMAELTEEYGDPRWQRLEFDSLEAAVEMNWEHRMPEALADTLAVLDAIVKPSEAMITAAQQADTGGGRNREAVIGRYCAMIAALRAGVKL